MTIELLARRLGASLAFGGLALWVAAAVSWATIGGGDEVVHSIHTVVGWVLVTFGGVMIASGLAITSAIPPRADQEQPPAGPETATP
jgi:hypothetical protein